MARILRRESSRQMPPVVDLSTECEIQVSDEMCHLVRAHLLRKIFSLVAGSTVCLRFGKAEGKRDAPDCLDFHPLDFR